MRAADSAEQHTLRDLLTDRLGWLSIRSAQILFVIALGAVQLKLVAIPAMIALILAAALNPVMKWLRRHRLPSIGPSSSARTIDSEAMRATPVSNVGH